MQGIARVAQVRTDCSSAEHFRMKIDVNLTTSFTSCSTFFLEFNRCELFSLVFILFQTIVALTFAQYAAKPFFEDCEPPENAVKLLGAVCLCK